MSKQEEINWPVVLIDDDGIRPAGKPDECFYCHQKVGHPHARDCVIVEKRVRVRYVYEVEVMIPYFWTNENFAFHRLESSSCANNTINDLEANLNGGNCLCGNLKEAEILEVTDATPIRPTRAEARAAASPQPTEVGMSELEKAKISWTGWYTAKVQEGCTAVSIERWAHWYCKGDDDKAETLSHEILDGIKEEKHEN